MEQLKGVIVGAGYFSQFHIEAWNRIERVKIVAGCDLGSDKQKRLSEHFKIKNVYADVEEMLVSEQPNFIDIITPPETHYKLCELAIRHGVHIICQKPIAPTYDEAMKLFELVEQSKVRFMVHENWRFQPWYREIKKQLESGTIGQFHTMNFRMRMGDGWRNDAYLDRQPYFRTMPRLLIHETGVHFIDTFRYLFGEVDSVYARLRQINPVIKGEDTGWVQFDFHSGGMGFFDGGRYNESTAEKPRFTFGECLIEGSEGSIRLYDDGNLTFKALGKPELKIVYDYKDINFMGDCVFSCLSHFVNGLISNKPFETSSQEYRKTLSVQEAIYRSNLEKRIIKI